MSFGALDRRAVASVATQFFVNGATFASFIPRLPEIRDRIDVSTGVLGVLMTTALVLGLAGSLISGWVLNRFGTRLTLIGGAALLVLTLPLIGFAMTPIVFVLALGLMAALDVVVDVSMNLQGSWLSARRHAPIMNRLHGLWSLGAVVGGLTAARLTASNVSLQTHLVGVSLVLSVAVVFVGRGLLRTDEHVEEQAVSPGSKAVANRLPLILLAVGGALAISVELVSNDWAAFRLADDFSTSAGFAGLGFVAFTSGMTIGRFSGDTLQLRLGHHCLGRRSAIAATIGLAGAALIPNEYAVLASYVLAGIGVSTFFPKLYDDAAQLPGKRGVGLAALTAGSRISGLVVPAVIGALASTSLSVGAATGIIVIPSALAFAVLTYYSPEPQR
ncbi:MAG: MFS transporter [Acidimicrobiales bacterium]